MISVKELKEKLKKYPDDARCYAYDGEDIGIVIVDPKIKDCCDRELGFIPASEYED